MNYDLLGNFYQANMNYVVVKLWKCQNQTATSTVGVRPSVTCKDKATIDSFFNRDTFSFAFINTMFVLDNYDQPI